MITMQHNPKRVEPTKVASRLLGAGSHFSRLDRETVAFAACGSSYPSGESDIASPQDMDCGLSGIGTFDLTVEQPGPANLA